MSVVYRVNGHVVSRREFMRGARGIAPGTAPNTQAAGAWPMLSDALGVMPEQIPEAREELRAKGVDANFSTDGRIEFRSRGHRKAVCEALGYYDRNGGYSDPQKRR